MRGRATILLIVLALAGCIDSILEGPAPPPGTLSVSLAPTNISIPQGGQHTITVTVNRIGNFDGAVSIAVAPIGGGAPAGITAGVTPGATVGRATSATITLQVAPDAAVGSFPFQVRSSAPQLNDAVASLTVTVTPKPEVGLTAQPTTLTIIRGGAAPLQVAIARVGFAGDVDLALTGGTGITAQFLPNPTPAATATGLVSVAPAVAPGSYAVSLQGSAAGAVTGTVPLTVVVSPAALQVFVDSELSAPQAGTVSTAFVLNQVPGTTDITFAVDGLPAGVVVDFPPGAPPGRQTMHLAVGPAVAVGSYPATLRASALGLTEATAPFTLAVTPAGIQVGLAPASLNVTAGGSASTTLTVARMAFAGPVAVTFENLPGGVTASAQPAAITGTMALVTVMASALAVPGPAELLVRATPVGLAATAAQVLTLPLNIVAPLPPGGNVVLDATRCQPPMWVAGQDGDGTWAQLLPQGGIFRFGVQSELGAYAWSRGQGVTVEFRTRAELTEGPIDICGELAGTKTVTGTGGHTLTTGAQWNYALGGGIGTSTTQFPGFAITGIRPGTHDLVVTPSSTAAGLRGLIMRDLDLPDGSSLGIVDLSGDGSFLRAHGQLGVSGGPLEPGGSFSASMHYLTTSACTVNLLLDNNTSTMYGVPESAQRPGDFHMQTVRWTTSGGGVVVSEVFRTLTNRILIWTPTMPTPTVTTLPGGHLRLRAILATIPASYNTRRQLQITDGSSRVMTVGASATHFALVGSALTMPDLSEVAGWPATAAIPVGRSGSWVFQGEGTNGPGGLCVEGRRAMAGFRRGAF